MLAKRSLNTATAIAASLCLGLAMLPAVPQEASAKVVMETVDVSKTVINANNKKTEKINLTTAGKHVTYIVPLSEWNDANGKKKSYASRTVELASDSMGAGASNLGWINYDGGRVYVEVWGPGEHKLVIRESFLNKNGKVRHRIDHTFTARLRIASIAEQNVVLSPYSKKNADIASSTLTLKHTTGDVTWTSSKPSVATIAEDGTITAVKKGVCTIKATTTSSLTKKPVTLSCSVDVVPAKARKAIDAAIDDYQLGTLQYSQSKRMQEGYRDCSSFVGRAYAKSKVKLGKDSWALTWSPPAADEAKYLRSTGKEVATKAVKTSKLRAGDLIFYSNTSSIDDVYHVAMYMGGGRVMHVSDYNPSNCVRYRYSILASESKKSLESDDKIVSIGRPCK